jgi:hypothetical protein
MWLHVRMLIFDPRPALFADLPFKSSSTLPANQSDDLHGRLDNSHLTSDESTEGSEIDAWEELSIKVRFINKVRSERGQTKFLNENGEESME